MSRNKVYRRINVYQANRLENSGYFSSSLVVFVVNNSNEQISRNCATGWLEMERFRTDSEYTFSRNRVFNFENFISGGTVFKFNRNDSRNVNRNCVTITKQCFGCAIGRNYVTRSISIGRFNFNNYFDEQFEVGVLNKFDIWIFIGSVWKNNDKRNKELNLFLNTISSRKHPSRLNIYLFWKLERSTIIDTLCDISAIIDTSYDIFAIIYTYFARSHVSMRNICP